MSIRFRNINHIHIKGSFHSYFVLSFNVNALDAHVLCLLSKCAWHSVLKYSKCFKKLKKFKKYVSRPCIFPFCLCISHCSKQLPPPKAAFIKCSNIVKYYYNKKKKTVWLLKYILKCNVFLWWQSWFWSVITSVFSVTWFFRSQSNMLIGCLRNIYYQYQY